MDLQEFVANAMTQIVGGIVDAQGKVAASGGLVNPRVYGEKGPWVGRTSNTMGRMVYVVDFDVAVTVTEGKETKAGGSLTVAGFGLGGQRMSEASSSSVSRVRFSVPFAPPQHGQ